MSKRRMKCLISFILAIVLVMAEPLSAFGYIGAIVPPLTTDTETKVGKFAADGMEFAYLENDHIHFDICIGSTKANPEKKDDPYAYVFTDKAGALCHTVPMETLEAGYKNLDKNGRQIINHWVAPNLDAGHTPGKYTKLTVEEIKVRTNVVHERYPDSWDKNKQEVYDEVQEEYVDAMTYSGELVVDYYFLENKSFKCTNYFTLVKLDQGSRGETEEQNPSKEPIEADPYDASVNWGVQCRTVYTNMEVADDSSESDFSQEGKFFRQSMDYVDFPRMGHASIKDSELSNIAVNTQYLTNSGAISYMNITSGITETQENAVLEVYSDSYSFASPFVATSYNYADQVHTMNAHGVEGHLEEYASSIEYKNNKLTTYGSHGTCAYRYELYEYNNQGQKTDYSGVGIHRATSAALWGFRDLEVKKDEETGQPTDPDAVKVRGDAPYLCVFPDGNKKDGNGKQIYQVLPADTADDITRLSDKYGTCVAKYQGGYFIDTVNGKKVYSFSDSSVAFSPTITATWTNPTKPAIRLWEDGTLEMDQDRVMLNAPTFKFYQSKSGGGLTFNGYDETLGLLVGIDSEKNQSFISIDLPGNGVAIQGASMDTTGNLVFTGKFKINLFAAQMEMKKLGYGLDKDSKFKCNGIQAEGKLKVPKIPGKKDDKDDKDDKDEKDASPNVLGFGGANMEGKINTFAGEEIYDFKFELTVKNLFSTKAELTLVRLNNGRLCPEHLWFQIELTAEGVGLDIPPGTPVVSITGGGGGIDGLASTIDGNYVAIPPVVLSLMLKGSIVKVVDGTLTARVGPSQIRLEAEDVGFKLPNASSLKIIDSMYAGIYLNGKEITYEDAKNHVPKLTYQGVAFGGEMGMGLKIFNFKDDDKSFEAEALKFFNGTIKAKVGLSAETYVGNAIDNSDWVYVYIGSTGTASCALCIPEGIHFVPKGTTLLGAGLDYRIVAQTAFQKGSGGQSVSQFFKNANLKGGVAASASVIGVNLRVIYFFPANKVKTQGRVFKKLDDLNWDKEFEELEKEKNKNKSEETDNQTIADDEETVMALCDPVPMETEDGDQVFAVVEANLMPIELEEVSSNADPEDLTAEGDSEELAAEADSAVYSKTISVDQNQTYHGDYLILGLIPDETLDDEQMNSFAASVSCNCVDEIKYLPTEYSVSDNNAEYNAWIGTVQTDSEGNPIKSGVFLGIPKDRTTAGDITVSANSAFTIKGLATTPVTDMNVNLNGNRLDVDFENLEDENEYVLNTYMGQKTINEDGAEQITTDYLVDSRTLTGDSSTNGESVSLVGDDLAPTGDYYLTTTLVEKSLIASVDDNGDPVETHEVETPVATWQSDSTYHYTNNKVPVAPATAQLELLGNEAMKGSWKKVDGADGYKVTIYQKDANGEYVDTQRGFNFTNEDFVGTEETAPVQGLAYDEATGTYSVEIAMTVGESGDSKEVEIDGQTESLDQSQVEGAKALTADKTYKIGVSAYKNDTMQLEDGTATQTEETELCRFSPEKESNEKYLPVYKPVTFSVAAGRQGEERTLQKSAIDPNEPYVTTVKGDVDTYIRIEDIKENGTDVTSDTEISIAQVGMTDENGQDLSVSVNEVPGNPNTFALSGVQGSVTLEIKAKYNHDGVADETIDYLNINLDNTAPQITLENEITYATADGS
ncbi:MAG: hypothetical protein K6E84_06795, partial [Lachnospiraceae bacterium]|nr:hypothetical protein [Lachnospiraceae bacterium]